MKDVLIIGSGPAGCSAAVYLCRAGFSVTILSSGDGALGRAHAIENYYGFAEPIDGPTLLAQGRAQAARLGAEILQEEALAILPDIDGFTVKTSLGTHTARTLLLATGKSRSGLPVPGFEKLRGRGISFCAVCDGFFYRGKPLGLIGSSLYAAEELQELLRFSQDITLFTNGEPLTASFPEGVRIVTDRITAVEGEEKVSGVTTTGGSVPLEGLFVAIGTAGAAEFAAKLGVAVEKDDILVDENFMTNLPGIFAAGDCIGGLLQVAKAVSDGAQAARAMIAYLKKS